MRNSQYLANRSTSMVSVPNPPYTVPAAICELMVELSGFTTEYRREESTRNANGVTLFESLSTNATLMPCRPMVSRIRLARAGPQGASSWQRSYLDSM